VAKKQPSNTDPPNGAQTDQAAAEAPAAAEQSAAAQASPLESLRAELEEAKDRALRMQAELENYRKRAARELQEERRYAGLPLIRDLLPVLDNMNRAVEAAEKSHDPAGLLEGLKMVAGQLEEVFQRHHCNQIEALHEPFNPHLHEAISQQPSDDHPAGTVMLVTRSGFQLHDRVVRPSQVIVSGQNRSAEEDKQEAGEEKPE
jgi:molecular chaperone GrpE